MMTLLRKHRQWLMIVIAILAIPFCFYFVKTDPGAIHSDRVARIYDQNVTRIDFQRSARLFTLARQLGMMNFLQDLIIGANSETDAITEFTCNSLILQHEAEKFGIRPTAPEIANVVRTFPAFQGKEGFDLGRYTEFVQNVLPSLGFNESEIEELAGDQISLERIKQLISSNLSVPESELKANYEQSFGKLDVTVARLKREDFAKNLDISDADIAKYFDGHKAQLQTEPKRKVDLVGFTLTDEQKKLTGKSRIEALQKLADRANDFTQALLEKGANFSQVASKFQIPVQTTADFPVGAPDASFKGNTQLSQTAFQLTTEEPNSDAIQTPDGFYIMHLVNITPARALTLEEAKPKIVESLRTERSNQLMADKAAEAIRLIREKMNQGATADQAIEQAGFKPEKIPPFSLMENQFIKSEPKKEENQSPELLSIKGAVADLNPGQVSEFTRTTDGGLIAVLEKREPLDEAQFAQARPLLDQSYVRNMSSLIFFEWLRDRRRDSGFQLLQG